MKTYLDCFPCFLNQAFRAASMATDDERKIKRVLDEVGMMLKDIPLESTPPESGRLIHQKIRRITGNKDPYKDIKNQSTRKALTYYSALKRRVEESADRLLTAIRLAIAGNAIDFGPDRVFDMEEALGEALEKDFAICDYGRLRRSIDKADEILYIADNAGECVFDRILIEEIKKPVIYAVRDVPVINDATLEDALQAGLDQVATIVSSGTDAPGAILKTCNAQFLETYRHSECIISKGQGNYEALSGEMGAIFFLLMTKCGVIAKEFATGEGDMVLMGANGHNR